VAHQNDRPIVAKLLERREHERPRCAIEPTRRLVEQENRQPSGNRSRERDPLALAS